MCYFCRINDLALTIMYATPKDPGIYILIEWPQTSMLQCLDFIMGKLM